jgi:hypothetical protein
MVRPARPPAEPILRTLYRRSALVSRQANPVLQTGAFACSLADQSGTGDRTRTCDAGFGDRCLGLLATPALMLAGMVGLEPTTNALTARDSTN